MPRLSPTSSSRFTRYAWNAAAAHGKPLSALRNRQKFPLGKFASAGRSTNTSSVIGVRMNATLKSAVAAKSEYIAESVSRILAATGPGVPACTLGSVPSRTCRTTSRLRAASPFHW